MSKRLILLIAMLLIGVMALTACGGDTPTATPIPAAATDTPAAAAAPTGTTAAAAPTHTNAAAAPPTDPPAAAAPTDPAATAGSPGSGGNLQVIWFAWQPCQALTDLSKKYP